MTTESIIKHILAYNFELNIYELNENYEVNLQSSFLGLLGLKSDLYNIFGINEDKFANTYWEAGIITVNELAEFVKLNHTKKSLSLPKLLGLVVEMRRTAKGITRQELADLADVNVIHLSHIASFGSEVDLDVVERVLNALDAKFTII